MKDQLETLRAGFKYRYPYNAPLYLWNEFRAGGELVIEKITPIIKTQDAEILRLVSFLEELMQDQWIKDTNIERNILQAIIHYPSTKDHIPGKDIYNLFFKIKEDKQPPETNNLSLLVD